MNNFKEKIWMVIVDGRTGEFLNVNLEVERAKIQNLEQLVKAKYSWIKSVVEWGIGETRPTEYSMHYVDIYL